MGLYAIEPFIYFRAIRNVTSALLCCFPSFQIWKPNFRLSSPVFHIHMVTTNSIHHIHIYYSDFTLHGMKTIFNKMQTCT